MSKDTDKPKPFSSSTPMEDVTVTGARTPVVTDKPLTMMEEETNAARRPRITDAAREEAVTNEQLMKMLKAETDARKALEARLGDRITREAGQVDYYHCNACGLRLEMGKRCPTHPDDLVMGVGVVFNHLDNSVRLGAVTKS